MTDNISIHALLAESDSILSLLPHWRPGISIHALLAESDATSSGGVDGSHAFLSTLSLRRATGCIKRQNFCVIISIHALLAESDKVAGLVLLKLIYFYPRSPCGERRQVRCPHYRYQYISIHALLAESDRSASIWLDRWSTFLSTLSLRRATLIDLVDSPVAKDFYPRSPCGERPDCLGVVVGAGLHFYPRSPCGERLLRFFPLVCLQSISIHALLAESDV